MADRDDFATEVGGLIKGRSPVGHTHTRLDAAGDSLLIDSSGGVQQWVDGVRVSWTDQTGKLVEGTVPWARIPDKPVTFPPAAHTHDDRYYTETETDQKLATKSSTGHTHNTVQSANGLNTFTIYDSGVIHYSADGEVLFRIGADGTLAGTKVPWSTLTDAPAVFPPSAHTHNQLDVSAGYRARLDGNGIFQLIRPDGTQVVRWSLADGTMSAGIVPWARLTEIPDVFTPAPHRHDEYAPTLTGAYGPLVASLANAATMPVPILFVGSSTTAGSYPRHLIDHLAAAYPSGTATPGTVRAHNTPVTPHAGPGVAGYNAGISGSHSGTYLPQVVIDNAAAIQPVAIIHGIGSNDWAGSVPPATFETNLRAAIDTIDSVVTVPHVHIIFQQHTRAGTRTYDWGEYTTAMRGVAAEADNRVFLDLGPALDATDPTGTNPFGMGQSDQVHLSTLGDQFLAELMGRALGVSTPPAPHDSGVNVAGDLLNGWTGTLTYTRTGDLVEVAVSNLNGSAASSGQAFTLPPGYRPRTLKRAEVTTPYSTDGARNPARLTIDPSGAVILYSHNDLSGQGYYGDAPAYSTLDPLP